MVQMISEEQEKMGGFRGGRGGGGRGGFRGRGDGEFPHPAPLLTLECLTPLLTPESHPSPQGSVAAAAVVVAAAGRAAAAGTASRGATTSPTPW